MVIIQNKLTVMPRSPKANQSHQTQYQIKKIYCAYHPQEVLTNFCCDVECLMPLCPNCIVEHTQQHFLEQNKPTYVNVHEAINETKHKCYQNIVLFQELSKGNDKIYDYLMGLRESIHNQLTEDKQQLFKQFDLMFQIYEQKLYNEALSHYKELQVYDRKETANISDFITQQIEIIHQQIGVMKGENCLAGLINFYKHDGKIYQDSIRDITQYVDKHKKAGKISVNSDANKLREALDGFCQKNLTVEFINDDVVKQGEKMKASSFSKEGNKSLSHKLSKQHLTHTQSQPYYDNLKQNNFHNSNQEYRNMVRRSEQYYKIDASELKSSKAQPNSNYYKQISNRHRY